MEILECRGNHHRRQSFLGATPPAAAAAQFSTLSAVQAPAVTPEAKAFFTSLRQIDAGALNVGYAEVVASDDPVVIHLHGWLMTSIAVPMWRPLARAGYRVVVPYLRGCGTTWFRSRKTARNGSSRGRRGLDRHGCARFREGHHRRL